MTTIAAGQSGSYTFTELSNVTVSLDSGEHALVVVLSSAGDQLFSDRASSTKTIGPFPTGAVLTVTADGAAVDYAVSTAKADGNFSSYTGKEAVSYATDPLTGLDVLDAGSREVVLGSGLDFGATPIAPLHTFDAFDSTAITTAAQYYADIDAWAADLPQVTKTDLGVSSDGLAANHLYEYKTGTGPIKILIVCGAHGPELTTSWAAYMWFKALATSNSTLFSMLRSRLTVSWIPTGNPAQFRGTRQNANGVDLNRNYPFYWANYSTGTSGVGQENYKGASALSEAEPLAIKALIDSGGIHAVMDLHSYENADSIYELMAAPPSQFTLFNRNQFNLARDAAINAFSLNYGSTFDVQQDATPNLVNWATHYLTNTKAIPYASAVLLEARKNIGGSTATNLTSDGATKIGGFISSWVCSYLATISHPVVQPNHSWQLRRANEAAATSISSGGTMVDATSEAPLSWDEAVPSVGVPRNYVDCPVVTAGYIDVSAEGTIEGKGVAETIFIGIMVDGVASANNRTSSVSTNATSGNRFQWAISHRIAVTTVDATYIPRIQLAFYRSGVGAAASIKRARIRCTFVPGNAVADVPRI